MNSCHLKYLPRSSCMKPGKTISGLMHKSRAAYLLPRLGRKRRNALVMFGKLIGYQLARSSLFNMAESIVKRIKTYLFMDWARLHVVKAAPITASKLEPSDSGDGGGTNVRSIPSNKQFPPLGGAPGPRVELRDCYVDMNRNVNAKSSSAPTRLNKRGKKSCKGKARCLVAMSTGRPTHRQRKQSKASKPHTSYRCSQQSERLCCRKRPARREGEVGKPRSPEIVDPLQFVEILDTNTGQKKTEHHSQTSQVECPQQPDPHKTENHSHTSQVECPQQPDPHKTENHSQTSQVDCPQQPEPQKTESVQCSEQAEATLDTENKRQLVKKKQAGNKRRKRQKTEMKLNMFVRDPNDELGVDIKDAKQMWYRKRSTPLRRKCDRVNFASACQPSMGSSTSNLKTTLADMNDWPSLVEYERPKGLIKEAAMGIVRNKLAGSMAKNARKLLADIAAVRTNEIDANRQPTVTFTLANPQSGRVTTASNQKTWASVASHSLVDTSKEIGEYTAPVASLVDSTEDTGNNPPTDIANNPPDTPLQTSQSRSESDCSLNKNKPKPRNCLTEIEGRTQLRKLRRSMRLKMKQKCDGKDQVLVEPSLQKNKRRKEFERSGGRIGCPPSVQLSDKFSKDAFGPGGNFSEDGRHVSIIHLWKKAWAIKGQIASSDEDGAGKQKKISTKYRALLRSESGHVDVKTVTEVQTRSKTKSTFLQDKTATRSKQRKEQLERQRAYHNYQPSPALVSTKASINCPYSAGERSCPYWLRFRSRRNEIAQSNYPSRTEPNSKGVNATRVSTVNIASPLSTNITPCRRSERLRAKHALKSASPCYCCQ